MNNPTVVQISVHPETWRTITEAAVLTRCEAADFALLGAYRYALHVIAVTTLREPFHAERHSVDA